MPGNATASAFHPTRWTLVMQARGDSHESRAALSELCAAYWNPVFHFLRREGRNDDDSRELAQEFFARLLARGGIGDADRGKGRFRSYLLGALKHFLAERRRNEGREKRGGNAVIESLDSPRRRRLARTANRRPIRRVFRQVFRSRMGSRSHGPQPLRRADRL